MAVDDQAVIGGGLRIGLPGNGEPGGGHILPGIDVYDSWHFFRDCGIDVPDYGVGVGTAQQFYYKCAVRRDVVRIDGFPQQQLHGVFLAD